MFFLVEFAQRLLFPTFLAPDPGQRGLRRFRVCPASRSRTGGGGQAARIVPFCSLLCTRLRLVTTRRARERVSKKTATHSSRQSLGLYIEINVNSARQRENKLRPINIHVLDLRVYK